MAKRRNSGEDLGGRGFCGALCMLVFLVCFIWGLVSVVGDIPNLEHDRRLCEGPEVDLWIFKITSSSIVVGIDNKTGCCLAEIFYRASKTFGIYNSADRDLYLVGQSYIGKKNGNGGNPQWIFDCPSKKVFDEREKIIDQNIKISWSLASIGLLFCCCLAWSKTLHDARNNSSTPRNPPTVSQQSKIDTPD